MEKSGDTVRVGTGDVGRFVMLTFFIDPGFDYSGIIFGRRGGKKISVEKTDLVRIIIIRTELNVYVRNGYLLHRAWSKSAEE